MFDGLSTPVIFLQNVDRRPPARAGLQGRLPSSPITSAAATTPSLAFITMNLPVLLDVLEELGIENPIVCANINKIGFRMCGGLEAYEQALRERQLPGDGDVRVRLGAIPPRRRSSGSVSSPTSSRSCSARPAPATSQPRVSLSTGTGLSLDDDASSSPPPAGTSSNCTACTDVSSAIDGPFRWATFDTPQSRSLLEGEAVDFVHFVGGRDPGNVATQCAPRAADPARERDRHHRQHRLGHGAAVLRARPGAGASLPLYRERRAQRRAVEDGEMIIISPASTSTRSTRRGLTDAGIIAARCSTRLPRAERAVRGCGARAA